MNRDLVLINLQEATDQLNELIRGIKKNRSFSYGDYLVEIQHIYHHLNFAWNIRNVKSKRRIMTCKEGDFKKWGQFPQDIVLY